MPVKYYINPKNRVEHKIIKEKRYMVKKSNI